MQRGVWVRVACEGGETEGVGLCVEVALGEEALAAARGASDGPAAVPQRGVACGGGRWLEAVQRLADAVAAGLVGGGAAGLVWGRARIEERAVASVTTGSRCDRHTSH